MCHSAVLQDLFTVLPDDFVHLGGDEANTACWASSPEIVSVGRRRLQYWLFTPELP